MRDDTFVVVIASVSSINPIGTVLEFKIIKLPVVGVLDVENAAVRIG